MFFIWLVSYGIVTLLSRHFAGMSEWSVPAGLFINAATLAGWLYFKGQKEPLGFRKLTLAQWKQQLFLLPYLLPVAYNFLRFGFPRHSAAGVLAILFAAVLEELVFRGVLLHYFSKRGYVFGMAVCAALFAAAHLLNLETGAAPIFLLCQVLFALAAGFAWGGIKLSCGSLFPCIGLHFLINLTAGESAAVPSDPLYWVCIAVYLVCGIRSVYILNKTNQEGMFL